MIKTENVVPNGSAWAAVLAAGIGCASFGLLADLSEASKSVSHALNFYSPTGDLSGKSTLTIVIWLVAWVILHLRWKARNIDRPGTIAVVSVALVVMAIISTFPPFFEMFSAG